MIDPNDYKPKLRKRPQPPKARFEEPGWMPTTFTPPDRVPVRYVVTKEDMEAVMHTQLMCDFEFYGSRSDLRRLKDPDG